MNVFESSLNSVLLGCSDMQTFLGSFLDFNDSKSGSAELELLKLLEMVMGVVSIDSLPIRVAYFRSLDMELTVLPKGSPGGMRLVFGEFEGDGENNNDSGGIQENDFGSSELMLINTWSVFDNGRLTSKEYKDPSPSIGD